MGNKTLIDTHCHINAIVKKKFDQPLSSKELADAQSIITQAKEHNVATIVNVGTSLPESENCIKLAQMYLLNFAVIGIHPNDCTQQWKQDFTKITQYAKEKKLNKIVGIGETGIDRHYPDYNLARQQDAFKAHIELALKHNLGIVVHSRDACDETLTVIDQYSKDIPIKRLVMHCFSYDQACANWLVEHNFLLGIGGTITYPKNNVLRTIVLQTPMENIVLETDAPFLPPQSFRGKTNYPHHLTTIAQYLAELKNESLHTIATITTQNATTLYELKNKGS
jgi:TatD DNase family protein